MELKAEPVEVNVHALCVPRDIQVPFDADPVGEVPLIRVHAHSKFDPVSPGDHSSGIVTVGVCDVDVLTKPSLPSAYVANAEIVSPSGLVSLMSLLVSFTGLSKGAATIIIC